jgi:hypothetical protein
VDGQVPRFSIGAGYAVYRGATTTGHVHRHAAFQIAIGMQGEVAIVDASGIDHRAAALVVAPMEPHCLQATPDVLTYFVEPHCAFADRLSDRHGTGISAAPELRDLREDDVRPAGDPRRTDAGGGRCCGSYRCGASRRGTDDPSMAVASHVVPTGHGGGGGFHGGDRGDRGGIYGDRGGRSWPWGPTLVVSSSCLRSGPPGSVKSKAAHE